MRDEDSPIVKQRAQLHENITDAIRLEPDYADAILSGWVLLAEIMTPGEDDYHLHMVVRSGDATGTSDLRPWTAAGWVKYIADRDHFFEIYDDEEGE